MKDFDKDDQNQTEDKTITMSAPQSVQKMVHKSIQSGGQGSTQHPIFNACFS